MANIAIFASGNGSNFEAIAESLVKDKRHTIVLLIYDRKDAYVVKRAEKYNIKSHYVNYFKHGKENAEKEILKNIQENKVDVIFLAGFMRILSPYFIQEVKIPIINIHPSLLPKYKGTHAIERAYNSEDKESGITIHYVNEELDSGEIIIQKSIPIDRTKDLLSFENEIHKLEHFWYPKVVKELCDKIDNDNKRGI
ncbi:MAG TPA: phosphoribosylglycinamide formyltransferase [Spirochaetota bacterium]|nr:phosphoribosylglycinamide formyltransferase [Spirochaetota bacterium]HOL56588.1 phosphoribosylglycinamide formyltransferase [Spirochaetota bacterium]HPP04009.1 phosphoribosylglycinamide formyltransferase [Spirochaetota bacterium]